MLQRGDGRKPPEPREPGQLRIALFVMGRVSFGWEV